MSELKVVFRPLDLRQATDHQYACLAEFKNTLNREYRPDDPPIPLEEQIQGWKNIPDFVEYEAYAAWDVSNSKIIAYADIAIYNTGDNEHLADFKIEVIPEHRRQGIARQALKLLLPFAKTHQRTLLFSSTTDHIHESMFLFEHLGARKGSSMHINQLKLSEFDKTLVENWLANSKTLSSEFELGFLQGRYPDTMIADIAALYQEVGNDQPRDDLEMEDMKFTPEILRQEERSMLARGNQRWTLYSRDRANGTIAGLTEVFWNPNRAMILNQGFTGVYPTYRNKGLGRWLKAEMMKKISGERPEVQFIRTGNATSNAPMLKINLEMGFKPYISNTIWQVETEKIEKYLAQEKV